MRTAVFQVIIVSFALGSAAMARPVLIIDPVTATAVSPLGEIQVDLHVDHVTPERLRSYRIQLEVVPTPGAVGEITLTDTVSPPQTNTSIQVDTAHPDWVFANVSGGVFVATNVQPIRLGATLIDPADAPEVTDPRYLGEVTLKASSDAGGDFILRFVIIDPDNPDADHSTQLETILPDPPEFDMFPVGGVRLTVTNVQPIPTLSKWGIVTMGLLLLVGGRIYYTRRAGCPECRTGIQE